jgi:hypothetical protein
MRKPAKTDLDLWRALARAVTGEAVDLEAFDPAEITREAERHGIVPLLHQRVHEGTLDGLASQAALALQALTRTLAASDMLLNDTTRKTLDLCARAGIDVLMLKGTPMAHLHYPVSYLRTRCDTDLFIPETQVEHAAAVLTANGYVLSGLGERRQSSRQFLAALPGGPSGHTHFDIHWKLSNRVLFRDALQFAASRAEAQPVPALGDAAYALSDADLLLHACIHRIAHGRNTERDRLLWLYDIHLLIEDMGEEDREAFKARALEKRLGTLCADALRVATELFGGTVPPDYLEALEERKKQEPTAKLLHASKLRWAWGDMAALGSLREKAAFAKELLFH